MARKVNITEKLSFDENPCLVIRGEEYEVRSDAKTMLEIMGDFPTNLRSKLPSVHMSGCSAKRIAKGLMN